MWHDFIANRLNRGMERYCQRELLGLIRELFNAVEHTTRRHRNAARANIEALLVVHDAQRGKHVVVIEERLSLTHADDV